MCLGAQVAGQLQRLEDEGYFSAISFRGTVYDALCRNYEVIGEAIKQIEREWPDEPERMLRFPLVAWREWKGMRDVLAHNLFGVDYRLILQTLHIDIGPLFDACQEILSDLNIEKSRARRSQDN